MIDDFEARVTAVAALDQPLRRALYDVLTDRGGWIGRDEAADAVEAPRSVVAFHLDKLVEAGLLEVRFERTSGKSGPGAGRPSKLYRRVLAEVSVSLPARHYDLAGQLLARAVEDAAANKTSVTDALSAAARDEGRRLGDVARADVGARRSARSARRAVMHALEQIGYEPTLVGSEIVLRNCPFHALAEEHRALVCGMNLDFLAGVIEQADGGGGFSARLHPEPGLCCVRLSVA